MSAKPLEATDTAFVEAGGRLEEPMGQDGVAHGCLDGLWVRWRWDCYDLGDADFDGEWAGWRRNWTAFAAPCTAEDWRAWRSQRPGAGWCVSMEVVDVG